jgi:hypothetical protein
LKIFNDGFEVYESGTLFVPNIKESKFILAEEPGRLEVIFRIEVLEGKEISIRHSVENEYTLAIIFTNPPTGGYSQAAPQRIGHIDGKELYVTFHVEMMGENQGHNLTYSFYVKGAYNG